MAAAGIASRILGAVYRIPLANLIGDEGMGLLELAQPLYNFFLVASVAGLPLAISKLVAERTALGDENGATRVLKVAVYIMLVTGLASSMLMYYSADWLAGRVYRDPRVALSIRSIAPALFFVTVMSAFRGFFQGRQQMGPSAASQVVEQFVRVGTMLVLATGLLSRGVEYAAAGAALGATAGGMAGLFYLLAVFAVRSRRDGGARTDGPAVTKAGANERVGWAADSAMQIVERIFAISLPVALGASVLPIIRAIDSAIVPSRLAAAGFGAEQATAMFGQLNGMAMPLVYFPNVLTLGLATSIVPAISESLALGGRKGVATRVGEATRITAFISLPAGFGLGVLASQICMLVYHRPDVGRVLASLAPAAAFLCILQTSGAVLQGMGHPLDPVKNLVIGSAAKVGLEYWLTGAPGMNVVGAGISTSVGFGIVAILNLADVARRLGRGAGHELAGAFVKPAVSAGIMAAAVKLLSIALISVTGRARLATVAAILLGVIIYLVAMLLVGGIDREDIAMIPKIGPRLVRLFGRFGLMR